MSVSTAIAFAFALLSTTLASLAYLRENDAAAALPALTLRHPLQSLRLLLTDRAWLLGFAMESGGFLFYAAALALAPLALVQSIAAGGHRPARLSLGAPRRGTSGLSQADRRGRGRLRSRRAGDLTRQRQRRRRPQRLDARSAAVDRRNGRARRRR